MTRKTKFGNRKTVVDGITFDSAAEALRWCELKLLERAGEITNLQRQESFDLKCNDVKIGVYRADFTYICKSAPYFAIEDVKGYKTPEYRLKAKIMAAMGFPITEIKA